MIDIEQQLQLWAESATRLSITPEMASKLGIFLDEARQNEKKIDSFLFTYRVDGKKVTGFFIAPKRAASKLPVLIFNRGGTGDFGLIPTGQYFTRIARMANWGYVVIGSYYPGNAFSEGHDERGGTSDVASILRLYELVASMDIADENAIGMYGESRGGMMTYLCMKEVDWIKAALTVGGLTNLERSLEERPAMAELFEKHFGNTSTARSARSAVKWANDMNKKTPLCLMHGGDDNKVNVRDALELAERLEGAGHPYSLHIFQGGDHGLMKVRKDRDELVRGWFNRHLKGE
ncbi:alpha/beta hydrolase family protein [Streptomyces brasiliscabiei]|uniref:alpha/beta hydrolase family protein n=1 Tax=Streptomyces brasiliscabiei TaxID=2736302 RepID=UPI001C1064D0|nr:prolyl oligopeptidase family serine peptidase [Streptomyces brasiliscabiei]